MINSTSDLIKALTTLTGALVTIVTISTLAWVVFRSELSTANITGLIKQYCLK